jgi:DNA-binding NtrC family response regulator
MDSLKVLLVDDETEFAVALAERLTLRGMKTTTANSGEDALRCMERERPQIMVLDLKMPGMGGLELLRLVKQKCPTMPVILLTGQGGPKDAADSLMKGGAFGYLVKPIKIEELMQTMREAMAQARTAASEEKG